MKKITLLLFILPIMSWSQSKVSNTISVSNISATISLNNGTQIATITIVGPSDRWLACQFGQFSGGMEAGSDVVYYNGSTLIDATHNGIGSAPTPDGQNNWTVTQNTVASGTRTLVATRTFTSPDTTDYDFVYSDPTIGIAIAQGNTNSFSMAYHGGGNRIVNTSVPFTLGVDDFSLQSAQLYPNPSNGEFVVKTKTALEKIIIYTHTGALVKTIKVNDGSDAVEVNVKGLQTGVYLVELVNGSERSWKKLIIE